MLRSIHVTNVHEIWTLACSLFLRTGNEAKAISQVKTATLSGKSENMSQHTSAAETLRINSSTGSHHQAMGLCDSAGCPEGWDCDIFFPPISVIRSN
jgi:hypothetical protein